MSVGNVSNHVLYQPYSQQPAFNLNANLIQETHSLYEKNIPSPIRVEEKSLGYILGEQVVGPIIARLQACFEGVFSLAHSIDKALTFPVAAAQEDDVTPDMILDIQGMLSYHPSACAPSSNAPFLSASLVGTIQSNMNLPNRMDALLDLARGGYMEFEVAKYFRQRGKDALIKKLFTPTEIDIIYNGPVVWEGVLKSDVGGNWDQGFRSFCVNLNRWANKLDYYAAIPTFEENSTHVGVYFFKTGTLVWRDLPKAELGTWETGITPFFVRVNRWANRHLFAGGLPTFEMNLGVVGVNLIKRGIIEWRDLPISEIGYWESVGIPTFCRNVHRWARNKAGYETAVPTFEAESGVAGAFLIGPKS